MKRKPSPKKSVPSRMVLLCSNIAVNPGCVVSVFGNEAGIVEVRMNNGVTYTVPCTTVAKIAELLR